MLNVSGFRYVLSHSNLVKTIKCMDGTFWCPFLDLSYFVLHVAYMYTKALPQSFLIMWSYQQKRKISYSDGILDIETTLYCFDIVQCTKVHSSLATKLICSEFKYCSNKFNLFKLIKWSYQILLLTLAWLLELPAASNYLQLTISTPAGGCWLAGW